MITYAYILYFYHTAFARMLRILVPFFVSIWLFTSFTAKTPLNIPLFILFLFLQAEIFFRYKVAKELPRLKVNENNGNNLLLSCTSQVLERIIKYPKLVNVIKALMATAGGEFILQKIPIAPRDVPLIELPISDLLSDTAVLVKEVNGKYITTMDLLVCYLLSIEDKTKLLFNNKIKKEELIEVLRWARQKYTLEENPEKKRFENYGGGIGDGLVTGWTPETKKYTQDFTYIAYKNKPQLVGRENEFSQMLEVLSKTENNNVLLVGNQGSGKENLVSLFALESFMHSASASYPHAKILEVMIGPLLAGATNRAELESRLQAIINEVSHSGNIVLYIPEFQNIFGSSSYEIDLSGALYPYLKSGKTPVIATVSEGGFKSYIEKNAVVEAFRVIKLDDPDKGTAMKMLINKTDKIEAENKVVLTYKAIEAAVEYADRYFQDASLPGSAASLLEDVAHAVSINKHTPHRANSKYNFVLDSDVVNMIQTRTHISIAAPERAEKELLLNLENRMHERVIDQEQAITAIAESMRRLRAGLTALERPISFLFLGPTGVGKTETAKTLAALYFGGEEKMLRLDMSEYADEDGVKRLLGAPPGEGEERGELTDKIADDPASLVLLDEFEKAHPKILDLFLQVLEDGRLTDNKGKTVSFVNSIVIATSNAGAEFIREEITKGMAVDKDISKKLLDYLQTQHLFRPELLNRFDDIVVFKPLGQTEMIQIAKILLADLVKRLKEQDINLSYDEKLLQKIISEGFDMQFGARPLRRFIQSNIEDIIAQKKLMDEIKRGSNVSMSVNGENKIFITIS